MTQARFSASNVISILKNIRILGTVGVLVFAASMLLVQKTESTNAFLSSMNNIKMGVGTDRWAPPVAPTIWGYKAVGAAAETEYTACEVMTDQEQVVFYWSNTTAELKTIANYIVGTAENPEMATYSNKTKSATFALAEDTNQLQVVAVDKRGTKSEPAVCAIVADRISPTIELTQPTATLSGTLVAMEASITETNLNSALFEIKDATNTTVATGGALVTNPNNASQSALTYTWNAAAFVSGQYRIVAKATDTVGHVSTTEKQISLDSQAPESTLTMVVPVATSSAFVGNGSFEQGLTDWTTQADVLVSSSTNQVRVQQGSKMAVLGSQNNANQVSLVSNSIIASESGQVQTIGFWYNLNPKNGVSSTEGMMVFVGNTQVYEEWLTNPTAGWRYLQLNVAGLADQTVTVAYSHDGDSTTGGELYLDGFSTNYAFNVSDISYFLTGSDNVGQPTVKASYLVGGQVVELTSSTLLNFTLPVMPDDQKISFWSVDSVGNVELKKSMLVPTLSSVAAEPSPTPSASPSPSPSPSPSDVPATDSASLKPVVTIADKGEYRFDLAITNLKPTQQLTYVIAYQHGEGTDQILDAIQGAATVGAEATEVQANNLYFGTCSSTAGVVCQPHVGVTNIEIILTVTDPSTGVITEYQFAYPGVWITESANEAV